MIIINLDGIVYEKLNMNIYNKRLKEIMNNNFLQAIGIKKNVLDLTMYGYRVEELVIGNGQKDLFIVGGTHGSEIIGVDFVLQLLANLDKLDEYDPNLITLHVIPLHNPEGFDITTQTLKNIDDETFKKEAYDYYLRYRTDNLINMFLTEITESFKKIINNVITPNLYLNTLKQSVNSNVWKRLCENRAIPKMIELEHFIYNLKDYNNYNDLTIDLMAGLDNLKKLYSDDVFFISAIKRFEETIFSHNLLNMISNNNKFRINNNIGTRLHQEKFADVEFNNTINPYLSEDIKDLYERNDIAKGSQVKFDATGELINLNLNAPNNQGIKILKEGLDIYGNAPSNNVLAYDDGPIGKSVTNPDDFTFALENILLNRIISLSIVQNRFLGALLYHGTGGVIYSKPMNTSENERIYSELKDYNDALTECYYKETGYEQISIPDNTGYGDMLRNMVPGIMLIELSKMGGNPIAPYGDIDNIKRVMETNFKAVNSVFKELNKKIKDNYELKR